VANRTARRASVKRNRPAGRRLLFGRTAVCSLTGISQRQLLLWEHEDLIAPVRHGGAEAGEPLYDAQVLKRVRLIRTLAEDLEVNLPGIDVILNLLDQLGH
jgi:chaperone modulatory protein CbpM